MLLSQSRLELTDYIVALINEIDIKAETLLINPSLDNAQKEKLEAKRKLFIDEIKHVESISLAHMNTFDSEKSKNVNIQKGDVFINYCFTLDLNDLNLTESSLSLVDTTFGYLIILDKYINKEKINLFKELLKCNNKLKHLNAENLFFNLKNIVKTFIV